MVNTGRGITLTVMHRFTFFLLALASAHCGGNVATDTAPPTDSGTVTVDAPSPEWAETAACATVQASCTTAPAVFVRGHAEGLPDLEGARVEFAVRYILEEGMGLDVPHGVVVGRAHVKGSAFEACVCVPRGANMYPQIAAAVYRPGSTSMISRDVVRASFSQRYATLGDEDVGYALKALPNDLQKEAAVAAMSDRTAKATLGGLGAVEGITAGLIADERPLAAQVTTRAVAGGKVQLAWTMPGRAFSSERIAFFVDRNKNGKCDVDGSDAGGFAPFATTIEFGGAWLEGSLLTPVCDALRADSPRE